MKNWLIGKDPDAGRDWIQEEKGTTEDEIAEWHHQLNGHEFEQALEDDSEGQGSLESCSSWGCRELAITEGPNNNNMRKKEILPLESTWIDLEGIVLSEISQRKIN